MTHETVHVALGDRSYDIAIGQGILQNAGKLIAPHLASNRVVIVTDENVAAAGHADTLQSALDNENIAYDTITLPAGEATKSFANFEKLLNQLLELRPDRKLTLIALGGGVIGDITGFAASVLLRGVPFIQVPTSLLAMVDSSVGGKTGINTSFGKNLIGSFYQPQLVLADVDVLDTLPDRELLAGYAEAVKYALVWKQYKLSDFEDSLASWKDLSGRTSVEFKGSLKDIVKQSCQAKADIVSQDEKESGIRALLNLGHTFGHALEAEMGYDGRLLHGEAVAVGMVLAFQYSCKLGMCSGEDVKRVEQLLLVAGLPVAISDVSVELNADTLVKHMYQDKKVDDGKLVFILVNGIGDGAVVKNVNGSDILSFLQEVM
jgi:3-dehydroquinate synthase